MRDSSDNFAEGCELLAPHHLLHEPVLLTHVADDRDPSDHQVVLDDRRRAHRRDAAPAVPAREAQFPGLEEVKPRIQARDYKGLKLP